MFDKIADFIMKHAKIILVLWIVALCVSVPFALKASDTMKYDLNSMASDQSESIQGLVIIGQYFPTSQADASSTPILVVKYDSEEGYNQVDEFVENFNITVALDEELSKKYSGAIAMPTTYSGGTSISMVAITYNSSDPYWSNPNNAINDTPALRSLINEVKSSMTDVKIETYLTGTPAISSDMSTGSMEDISRIDPFTVLLILILVGLFFRSIVSSATPPITIGFAFVVVMALIFGIGTILDVFFITEMMLLVSMMGAGCDYCIFIIARYREELRSGKAHEEALHEAIKWAGESITTSACSVIIGFGAMCICSYSMVSTMGICLAVGIIVALIAALTLVPSVLMLIGDRIFWPTRMDAYQEGGKATKGWYNWFAKLGERYFEKSSRFSLKHAGAIVIAAIIVTVPAAYMTFTNETSYDMISSMQSGDSGTGMSLMNQYANVGMLMPDYAVIEYENPIAYVTLMSLGGQPVGMLLWNDADHFSFNKLDKLGQDIAAIDDNVASVSTYFQWSTAYTNAETLGNALLEADKQLPLDQRKYYDPATGEDLLTLATFDAVAAIENGVGRTTNAIAVQTVIGMLMQYLTPTLGLTAAAEAVYMMAPVIDYAVNCGTANFGGDFAHPTPDKKVDMVNDVSLSVSTLYAFYAAMFQGMGVPMDQAESYTSTFIKVTMATQAAAMSPESMKTIEGLQNVVNGYRASDTNVVDKHVTGTAVVMYDVSKVIKNEFTLIAALVVVLILILLFFVMKSYVTPIRSVVTILMSIMWTLALTHIVFVNWLGSEVIWLIPLILLVICLGLGMDYDILLTTRIKENVMKGMSNDDSIHHAVTHTGSVITICGLIMGGAFGTLMLSNMTMMKEFGFALCFAILVDALIVRTYIVPAVMHLLGNWNWKGPKFLKGVNAKKE